MREIKFRGKRISDGQWLYGSLLISKFKNNSEPKCHVTQFLGNYTFDHEVNPETVGQFTGLKDRNGKEIYEGDIIQYNKEIFTVKWFIGGLKCVNVKPIDSKFPEWHVNYDFANMGHESYREILGNVYENPELLAEKS